jgi:ATP-dependent Zn protease
VYLVGPAGSGKTTIARQIAGALDLKFYCYGSIAADFQFPEAGAGRAASLYLETEYTPGSTSPITISVRAGDSAGSATFNPFFGAAANTFFKIRELLDT